MTGADDESTSGTPQPAVRGPVDRPVGRPVPERAYPGTDWPIARLTVGESGLVQRACLYAPGLPPGAHDVWCLPVAGDELSLDPDGDVALDWSTPSGDMLSMSVAPDGRLALAWVFDGQSGHATAALPPAVFSVLRKKMTPNVRVEPPAEGRSARTRCSASRPQGEGERG